MPSLRSGRRAITRSHKEHIAYVLAIAENLYLPLLSGLHLTELQLF